MDSWITSLPRRVWSACARYLREPERRYESIDPTPWAHPALNEPMIRRFRDYSGAVWQFAKEHMERQARPLRVAFCVNMAQNAYKWARLVREAGGQSVLYPHPMDITALNAPEWEEFDGESTDLFSTEAFLTAHPEAQPLVEVRRLPWSGNLFFAARQSWSKDDRASLYHLLAQTPQVRHEWLWLHPEFSSYYPWARELCDYDVSLSASIPIASYLSGQPYCAYSVGGDLQFDCGRCDALGQIMGLSFNAARFLLFTNPYGISYCRRLGFRNGLYFPYLMDDDRYSPGEGRSRHDWEQRFGPGFYILSTARIDQAVKGNAAQLDTLIQAGKDRPSLHFIFLGWGSDIAKLQQAISERGLSKQFHVLPPVGKRRLLDYYRSCDAVLDQFVYGYYGATGLEAASVGKPILMRIRPEQYGPFYRGDVAPVFNCPKSSDLHQAILDLVDYPELQRERGAQMRSWLVRNHGRARMLPILLGLLHAAAWRVPLPADLVSPLADPLSLEETQYHETCLQPAKLPAICA